MLPSSERGRPVHHRAPSSSGARDTSGLQYYSGTGLQSSGPMDGQMMASGVQSYGGSDDYDEFTEPPLLEELGIDFSQIWMKTTFVLMPAKIDQKSMEEGDLAGPLVYCILLGMLLLLAGKLYFGYIYGFGIIGCVGMYTVLNLMSDVDLDIHRIMSVLGYCLLPIVFLSALSIVVDLTGTVGFGIATTAVLWCTVAAVRFVEMIFKMREQRYLIAYPIFLLYTCFAMITVFGNKV
ncbi:unnamed protein product (mitochondrion) [Plasmodiophora brassicae]|uniref:Protein YIPF n=1 Tax=Plasmodiophora brassicae TaxID=37360 RepID=A0A0G4J631_PLABS|nr:hypothetical protein PBRA_002683 [Plasmodiophora brassicae]SPQ94840.1 unnamed protein product [Plasmodiophora brassicae]